jgi:hypothetical protein
MAAEEAIVETFGLTRRFGAFTAVAWWRHRRQHLDERRLAGAVGADKTEDLTGSYRERHRVRENTGAAFKADKPRSSRCPTTTSTHRCPKPLIRHLIRWAIEAGEFDVTTTTDSFVQEGTGGQTYISYMSMRMERDVGNVDTDVVHFEEQECGAEPCQRQQTRYPMVGEPLRGVTRTLAAPPSARER